MCNDKVVGKINFIIVQEHTPGVYGLFNEVGELLVQTVDDAWRGLLFDDYHEAAMQAQLIRYAYILDTEGLAKLREKGIIMPGSMGWPELDPDAEINALLARLADGKEIEETHEKDFKTLINDLGSEAKDVPKSEDER